MKEIREKVFSAVKTLMVVSVIKVEFSLISILQKYFKS